MKRRRQKMRKIRKASDVGASRGVSERSKNVYQNDCSTHLHYITWLSAATTIIASWHITDIWSGIVALLCGGLSVALINIIFGDMEEEE
jgi:hypothetical protein